MDIFSFSEKLMRMDDAAWARHANPWSGYSRIASSVPIFFALWSAHWIGWWAVLPIALVVVWVLVNPRLFPPPNNTHSWVTRGVLGERVFLNRKSVPIPVEHMQLGWISSTIAIMFLCVGIYGFLVAQFWTAFAGWFGAVLAKLWFLDRMVWLWADMKNSHLIYQAWSRADWSKSF